MNFFQVSSVGSWEDGVEKVSRGPDLSTIRGWIWGSHCVEKYGFNKLFVELIDHFHRNHVVDHGSKGIGCPGCFLEHYGVLLSFVV